MTTTTGSFTVEPTVKLRETAVDGKFVAVCMVVKVRVERDACKTGLLRHRLDVGVLMNWNLAIKMRIQLEQKSHVLQSKVNHFQKCNLDNDLETDYYKTASEKYIVRLPIVKVHILDKTDDVRLVFDGGTTYKDVHLSKSMGTCVYMTARIVIIKMTSIQDDDVKMPADRVVSLMLTLLDQELAKYLVQRSKGVSDSGSGWCIVCLPTVKVYKPDKPD